MSNYIQRLNNKLKFVLIFISFHERTCYEKEYNILILHIDESCYNNIKWFNSKDEITKIFNKYEKMITSIF